MSVLNDSSNNNGIGVLSDPEDNQFLDKAGPVLIILKS